MKILYIIHSCIMGGATISFLNLIKGIREKGCDIIVIHPNCEEKDKTLLETLSKLGCKIYELPVAVSYNKRYGSLLKRFLRPLVICYRKKKFHKQLLYLCRKEKPDIIHTNTGVVHEGFRVAKKLDIPHVWHLREYQTLDFNWKILPSEKLFKKYLKNSYTVCITRDIQKYFELSDYDRSFVIYNPIMSISETEFLENKNKMGEKNYFLVANRVSKEKGIEDILEAFSIFCGNCKTYVLKIAGFGDEQYILQLTQKCIDLGIAENVQFLGFISDVKSLMKNAKALIVGSYNEGFGRMTAEANMLGIPVIGRYTAGTKEILEQTNGGFFFNSVTELANALKKIFEMKEIQIIDFMRCPQKIATELFSSEQHINKMYNLYTQILALQ